MDPTLIAILLVLAVATVVGVLQARRRDKCLRHFDGYRITLGEAGGDLAWGDLDTYATGLEIRYVAPVHTDQGHLEQSFLIYKDQYPSIHAIYRYPLGLPPEQRARRADDLRQTVRPSVWRRLGRTLRNWFSMVRDSVVQALSLVIGMAKSRTPGGAVLAGQEEGLKSLSHEIIGYTGNAFDPLLERHLSQRVVVEVSRDGQRRSYCGWLKDYSASFIEILDVIVDDRDGIAVAPFRPGDEPVLGVSIQASGRQVEIANAGAPMVFVREVAHGDWRRAMDVVIPSGSAADVTLPPDVPAGDAEVWLGTAQRVDMVLPRSHALVKHAALLLPKPKRPEHLTSEEEAHTVAAVVPDADPVDSGQETVAERQRAEDGKQPPAVAERA
ncbi:MAG: hypothetical protein AAGI91_04535 [Bacteroidota bacterium]